MSQRTSLPDLSATLSPTLRARISQRHVRVGSIIECLALVGLLSIVFAGEVIARPATPIGLDFDAALTEGEWKLSYIYQRFDRKGLRRGKHKVKASEADSAEITQIPTELLTTVHTLGIQHAPFERLTVAINIPFVSHEMTQRDFDDGGDRYTTQSSGVGDIEVVGVVPFMEKGEEKLDIHLGLRFPSGEISNRDDVPDGAGDEIEVLLPRSMQTGSRTVAIVTGLSYRGSWEALGWGVYGTGSIGFGENHRDYRHGNHMEFSGWLAHDVTSWLSGSLRLGFDYELRALGERRVGPEDHLDSLRNATASKVLELSPGVSVGVPGFEGQRVRVEASWPVYQDVHATQVEHDWNLTTGWEWVF